MDDIFVDLRAAGLPTPSSSQGRKDLAKQIGFSDKHLDNVMSARKPYCGRLRDTIRALISAKGNGPAEPDPVFAPVIERAEPAKSELRYQLWAGVDKMRIIEVIAVVNDPDQARRLCDLLNKEAG